MQPSLAQYATTTGLLFLLGTCGMWSVLRTRLPQGGWMRQLAAEAVMAAMLGCVMAFGRRSNSAGRCRPGIRSWPPCRRGTAARFSLLTVLFAATGVGYFFTRFGLRLLMFWNRLRQQRLLWSITNAHLVLVALVVLAAALAIAPPRPTCRSRPPSLEPVGWLTDYLPHFIVTVLPTVGVFAVLGTIALLVILPPSALVSYFIAHGTTRRLENLARATGRAPRRRPGGARSTVEGHDEVAQLQSDFNTMAGELERSLHALQAERDRVSALLDARRTLVASVSHELRTPVATVRRHSNPAWITGTTPRPSKCVRTWI